MVNGDIVYFEKGRSRIRNLVMIFEMEEGNLGVLKEI